MPFKLKMLTYKKSLIFIFVTVILISFCRFCHAAEAARYDIEVKLDTVTHNIFATQNVSFTNNSDTQTKDIYFHIYPHRRYTKKEIRFIYRFAGYFKINPFPDGFQAGDLKVESALSGNKSLSFGEEGEDKTILKVALDEPLGPGQTKEIKLVFSVDIPHAYGRFGWHKGIISLNRWYPLLSVLDKNGWHNYPYYIYHHPYFSEAAYYNLKITLPKEEVVAATGIVKNETLNADGTKTIEMETEFPVRDFALGISREYLLHSQTDGKLTVKSYYLKGDQKRAEQAASFAMGLLKNHSGLFGEYPYSEFNIVANYLGYGGDQSSCLVFIDTRVYKLPSFLERYFDFLISHETGHQWFYNMIGSDEYKEMFLDEGMNSFWLLNYLEDKYGKDAKVMLLPKFLKPFIPNFSFRDSTTLRYIYMANNGMDRPVLGELSSFREPSSIFALAYGKGAAIVDMLRAQLGQETFDRVIKRYTQEFRFKNTSLFDFIKICNEESGQDLNWFFDQWLKTSKTCDFAVKKVSGDSVGIENRGSLEMPVKIKITFQDGEEIVKSWDGKSKNLDIPTDNKKVKLVEVDPDNAISLDLDKTNNYWPKNLFFEPVPLYFFGHEMPIVLPKNSINTVAGPGTGGSSLGVASSVQKPFGPIVRLSSLYDFNGKGLDSTLGFELPGLFKKQTILGFELFNYDSNRDKNDVSGGKLYFRRELWPASYGLFDANDHVTFYLIRNQKFDKSGGLNAKENTNNLRYRKKDEAILGFTGSFGRYGPYQDPDYGFKFTPCQEFAGHFLGGSEYFWRTSAELSNYYLIIPGKENKLASRIKAGWGGSADKRLFQLGGFEGLRGYDSKAIEGSRMLLGSLEYRFPLKRDLKLYFIDNIFCLDKIQMVGFFDAGKAWFSDFSDTDFKKDVGIGLRMHVNLISFLEKAVVRFDAARPINDSKEDTHFWFGINQTF